MDFTLNEDQLMIQDMCRKFAQTFLAPRAAEIDRTGEFPYENIKKMSELGFLGICLPSEYGGAELDTVSYALIIEEISHACASTGIITSVQNSVVGGTIYKFGTDEQKKKYLPLLASGEMIGAYALTESNAGSDAAHLETTVKKDGGHFILNGTKIFITNSVAAKVFIVYGTLDRSLGSKGICCFIVERDTAGFIVGKKEEMMGVRGSGTCELIFEDCRVNAENLIGAEGEGFKIAMAALDYGRIGVAAQAVGIAQACLDTSLAYSKERKQFGQPICNFEMIQSMLVEMATGIDAARLLVYRAADLRDRGEKYTRESSMAKWFASEVAVKSAIDAVQIHGGYGYTKEFPVERHLRDAKATQIYEGTSEIQKIVIARSLLSQ